jgi:acetyltransferase
VTALNLDRMFMPASIGVVGASERPGSVGAAVLQNLEDGGFSGRLFPVNPRYKNIAGRKCFSSIEEVPAAIDLAVVATPIDTVPKIVRSCVAAGLGGAVIVSSGGKEIGDAGRRVEEAIRKEIGETGFRVIGPNCLGILCARSRMNASFAGRAPIPGKIAFISQSGAICTAVLDLAAAGRIGFSHVVSVGSMLDVDFGDMIDYLGGDPAVNSIVMYVENFTRFRNLMSAARAVSRVKPIIALKAGRSRAGASAAASHTGALAGEDAVYDAAFHRAGIVRVKTFEELFDCAELLARQPRPSAAGLAIITNAGGPGVMAADALADHGMEPATLTAETLERLDAVLPANWSRANPVDVLGDAEPSMFRKAVEICCKAPEVNGLLILSAPQALADPTDIALALVDLLREQRLPVITSWMGGPDVEKSRQIFNHAGIPTFDSPERAVRAFLNLYRYGKNLELLQQIPPRFPNRLTFDREAAKRIVAEGTATGGVLTEIESKNLLKAYGIPVNKTVAAESPVSAVRAAGDLGYPVAMKILSRQISHKSDAGGVVLNLQSPEAVAQAFSKVTADARIHHPGAGIDGVVVEEMVESGGLELICGCKRDRDFGPVLLFGMGGTVTEVFADRALALPPLNRLLARQLMSRTRVYRLLAGYRNIPAIDGERLEEVLIRLSQLCCDFAEIEELDINPLTVFPHRCLAVDARVMLSSSPKPPPFHLVISPYPNSYEATVALTCGLTVNVRPIRPEDAPLMVTLFQQLSPRSVYFRFFSPLKHLPHNMLARFTQIDYDREIALVAIQETADGERMLGVARVTRERNPETGEFAVLVGDRWQGKGIGAELLLRCLKIAKEMGMKRASGIVLAENTQMLALGRKLGFTFKRTEDFTETELFIDLDKLTPAGEEPG